MLGTCNESIQKCRLETARTASATLLDRVFFQPSPTAAVTWKETYLNMAFSRLPSYMYLLLIFLSLSWLHCTTRFRLAWMDLNCTTWRRYQQRRVWSTYRNWHVIITLSQHTLYCLPTDNTIANAANTLLLQAGCLRKPAPFLYEEIISSSVEKGVDYRITKGPFPVS